MVHLLRDTERAVLVSENQGEAPDQRKTLPEQAEISRGTRNAVFSIKNFVQDQKTNLKNDRWLCKIPEVVPMVTFFFMKVLEATPLLTLRY